jgi:hypothetical protein
MVLKSRFELTVGILCLASGVLGMGYFANAFYSVAQKTTRQTSPPAGNRLLTQIAPHKAVLSGDIFRLPIDSRESLLLSLRGNGSELRYGVGAWVPVLEEWRSEDLFPDSKQASVSVTEPDAAGNKGVQSQRLLIPVSWRNKLLSWDASGLPEIHWRSGTVMRIRSEPSADTATGSTVRVEVAHFDEHGTTTVAYLRGRGQTQSTLVLSLPTLTPRDNTWVASRFLSRSQGEEELVVVGVLSGKFISGLDNSVRLNAGEAACMLVNARSQHVKVLQRATLERREGQILIKWKPVEDAYEPDEVWLYQTSDARPESRAEQLHKAIQGGYPLSPYAMWATQRGVFDF